MREREDHIYVGFRRIPNYYRRCRHTFTSTESPNFVQGELVTGKFVLRLPTKHTEQLGRHHCNNTLSPSSTHFLRHACSTNIRIPRRPTSRTIGVLPAQLVTEQLFLRDATSSCEQCATGYTLYRKSAYTFNIGATIEHTNRSDTDLHEPA
jgi:hypothetical protein